MNYNTINIIVSTFEKFMVLETMLINVTTRFQEFYNKRNRNSYLFRACTYNKILRVFWCDGQQ